MSVIYITEQGANIAKRGERIIVEKEGKELLEIECFKVDTLLLFGDRVQGSVFEVDLDSKLYNKMVARLERLIDPEEDSVRIYPVCSACLEKVYILGWGEVVKDEDVIVL